jgi:hypothetical protein
VRFLAAESPGPELALMTGENAAMDDRVFREHGWTVMWSFTNDVLVRCPRCAEPARVLRPDGPAEGRWRVSCLSCAYSKDTPGNHRSFDNGSHDPVRDPVFRLPLWLQTSCCRGNLLWAYNVEHLDVLEAFVRARIRQKRCAVCGHSHHQRMIHKLPRWLSAAKHRDEVLTALGRLRATLPSHR